jgi:hypothetical protein
MGDDKLRFCVVCGQGSHREKWTKSGKDWVACDKHTDEEIKASLPKTPSPVLVPAKSKASAASTPVPTPTAPSSGK